jgi:hypothetical protein
MNKCHDFLAASNIEILWEVIAEVKIFKNRNAFESVLTAFYETENHKNLDLVLLNKAFISSILFEHSPQQQQQQQHQHQQQQQQKIPITYEELQHQKLSQFEIKLTEKEDDFKQAMARPMPQQIPNFRDKMDEPMTEIEMIMKRTIAERNYDIAQIVSTNATPNPNQLKPQETSIKKEKLSPLFFASLREEQNKPEIKYIKIDTTSVRETPVPIDLDKAEKLEKHISWDKDIQENIFYNSDGPLYEEKDSLLIKEPQSLSSTQVKTLPNRIEQMKKIHDETLEVFRKKNADYGDSFATYGIIGILVRIEDKMRRAISISKNGVTLVSDEGIRDTLLDLHNYAAMGLMLMDEE